jgi:hypothetical protein
VTPPDAPVEVTPPAQPTPEVQTNPPTSALPSITADESAYSRQMQDINSKAGGALTAVLDLIEADTGDLFVSGSDSQVEMVVNMAMVKTCYTQATKTSPPASLAGIHSTWLAALKSYSDAMDRFAKGIENVDSTTFQKGVALLQAGNTEMKATTAALNEWTAARQGQ